MDLSPDQREVYAAIVRWVRNRSAKSLLTVSGLAGTGKTTLLGKFAFDAQAMGLKVAYVTPTGRASSVLRRKFQAAGVESTRMMLADDERVLGGRYGHLFYGRGAAEERMPFCDTVHRLLYRPIIDSRTEELRGWEKRSTLDRPYDLICLDESSMVGSRMLADIQVHGRRILAVGDHGQLPPVKDTGTLMLNPDLRLEKIHRQAEGSPIIRIAHALRATGRFDPSLADGEAVRVLPKAQYESVLRESLSEPTLDVAIVCWKHATRVKINRAIRTMLGYDGMLPKKGEPVMALHNYPPVYNGMRGVLTRDVDQPYPGMWWLMRANIDFPDDAMSVNEDLCRDQFHRMPSKGGQAKFGSVDELKAAKMPVDSMGAAGRLYDFAYAATIHKMQGSSFDHVIVCVDWPETGSDESRRMAYTAATRASRRLTILR